MTKAQIGRALASIREDVIREALGLVDQYERQLEPDSIAFLRQAVDTPQRARARLLAWRVQYEARHGANTAGPFLDGCLAAAGSSETVATLDAALEALEAQAQTIVDGVTNSGWTWQQVADWLVANVHEDTDETLTYRRLPIPEGYIDVWGDPW